MRSFLRILREAVGRRAAPGAFGAAALFLAAPVLAQELPPPPSNLQVIPAGSLIIAMDNAKQNEGALFNLRAYGLANDLLHNDIPLKWVIRTGKPKDGVDFTATATRIAPTALAAATLDFSGGPIIVHSAYAARARTRITAFNAAAPTRRVAVYELTQDVTVDVRYELTFKPRPFVNSTNSSLGTGVLDAAGITNYTVGGNSAINANSCHTILIEPHNTNTSAAAEIRSFLLGGGNFFAQCASVLAFENEAASGRYLTTGGTTGLAVANTGNVDAFPNPDLPFSQFIGTVTQSPGGSEEDWRLSTGASFRDHAHAHVRANGFAASAQPYAALAGKIRSGVGGMVFYLGGHDNRGSTLGDLNLQRMMLNAVLTPAARPSACNIIVSVPDLAISKTHTGSFYVDSLPSYTIGVSNVGTASTLDTLVVTDTLPAGITYQSASGTGWTFSVSGRVVVARFAGSLAAGAAATLSIRVRVESAAIGGVVNRAHVAMKGEVNTTNNTASHTVTAFGQPRLTMAKTAATDSIGPRGIFLTYRIVVTNIGTAGAVNAVVVDSLPPQVEFRVGSPAAALPAGVSAAVEYSSSGTGSVWTYNPLSGGCGASAGFDRCVRRIRWRLLNPLPAGEEQNTGTLTLGARIP